MISVREHFPQVDFDQENDDMCILTGRTGFLDTHIRYEVKIWLKWIPEEFAIQFVFPPLELLDQTLMFVAAFVVVVVVVVVNEYYARYLHSTPHLPVVVESAFVPMLLLTSLSMTLN